LGDSPAGVDSGPRAPSRNLESGTKHGKGGGCKTRKEVEENRETTNLSVMGKVIGPYRFSFIAGDDNNIEGLGLHGVKLWKLRQG